MVNHYQNCPSLRDYRGHPERCECDLISGAARKMARELIEITHAAMLPRLRDGDTEYVERDALIAEFRRHVKEVLR